MRINDKVYGEFEISEPILIDLINSKAVQRLKGIAQQGIPPQYNTQPYFSRYDHSLGVMILLRKLNASLKEQIAGLIHDISHTAFSHLTEWVYGDPKIQKDQDEKFVEILNKSDVPGILKKYNFEANEFHDLEKYTLLEKKSPDLCADRIDYCLRDLTHHGGKTISDKIVNHLINKNGEIVFDSVSTANLFAHEYLFLQRFSWGDDGHVARFHIFADLLKKGLDSGVITKDDFYESDSYVLDKLEKGKDREIVSALETIKKGFLLEYNPGRGILLQCKFRFVDPKIFGEGRVLRLSEVSENYSNILEIQRQHFNTKRFVEIFSR